MPWKVLQTCLKGPLDMLLRGVSPYVGVVDYGKVPWKALGRRYSARFAQQPRNCLSH